MSFEYKVVRRKEMIPSLFTYEHQRLAGLMQGEKSIADKDVENELSRSLNELGQRGWKLLLLNGDLFIFIRKKP